MNRDAQYCGSTTTVKSGAAPASTQRLSGVLTEMMTSLSRKDGSWGRIASREGPPATTRAGSPRQRPRSREIPGASANRRTFRARFLTHSLPKRLSVLRLISRLRSQDRVISCVTRNHSGFDSTAGRSRRKAGFARGSAGRMDVTSCGLDATRNHVRASERRLLRSRDERAAWNISASGSRTSMGRAGNFRRTASARYPRPKPETITALAPSSTSRAAWRSASARGS